MFCKVAYLQHGISVDCRNLSGRKVCVLGAAFGVSVHSRGCLSHFKLFVSSPSTQ